MIPARFGDVGVCNLTLLGEENNNRALWYKLMKVQIFRAYRRSRKLVFKCKMVISFTQSSCTHQNRRSVLESSHIPSQVISGWFNPPGRLLVRRTLPKGPVRSGLTMSPFRAMLR